MTDPLPIPDELRAEVPPDAQEAIAAVFLATRERVNELEARAHDLGSRKKPGVFRDTGFRS
jgi:transposase